MLKSTFSETSLVSNINRRGYITLLGGFLVEFVMGVFVLWGNIGPYVTSYLRLYDDKLSFKDTTAIYPILSVSASCARLVSRQVAEKIGFHWTLRASMIVMGSALILSSFVQSFALFVFFFAVLVGFAGGLGTVLPIWASWEAIPDKPGLVSGVTTAGFGFGSFLLGLIAGLIANPHGVPATIIVNKQLYFGEEVARRVPLLLQVLGGVVLIFGLGGSILIKDPLEARLRRQESVLVYDNIQNESMPLTFDSTRPSNEIKFKRAIRTQNLWILAIVILLTSLPMNFVASYFKFYGESQENLNDDTYLTILACTSFIVSGFTKIGWGIWNDKASFKIVFGFLVLVSTVCLLTLNLINGSKTLYFIWIGLILLCFGGVYVLAPTICCRLYGNKIGTQAYGFLDCFMSLGNVLQYFTLALLIEDIGFYNIFYLMGGISAAGLIIFVALFSETIKSW